MVRRSGLDHTGLDTIDETFEFFRYVEFVDGCWLWTRSRRDGREVNDTRIGKLIVRPKRIAWYWWSGSELDPDWNVTSMCGNSLCVNPFHLMHSPKGWELWEMLGHCQRFHPLDLSRTMIRDHGRFVVCMDCQNETRRERYRKNKYKNRRS